MPDPIRDTSVPAQIQAERTHLTIPSLPHWIEPAVEHLRQRAVMGGACEESGGAKLVVALHEAITNAMLHGNLGLSSELKEQGDTAFAEALAQRSADPELSSRIVDIVVDYDGGACRWIITDEGQGFDVERVLARVLSDDPEILLASGRGILMMKSFLDDVQFSLGGRRVTLTLTRRAGLENRRNRRVSVSAPFEVTPIDANGAPRWDDTYSAVSLNLSENGIALLQKQLATSGKLLIGVPTENGVVHIPAEIKHSRPLGANGMELGCQFVDAIDASAASFLPDTSPQLAEVYEAIHSILDAQQTRRVPAHERRAHARVGFHERVAIQTERQKDPVIAFARDLSKGGMALIAQESMQGEVTVHIPSAANRPSLKLRSRVVRCSRIQDGFFDVGLAFLHVEAN